MCFKVKHTRRILYCLTHTHTHNNTGISYCRKMLAKLHIRNSPEKLDGPKKHVIWNDLVNISTDEFEIDGENETDGDKVLDGTNDDVGVIDTLIPEQIHADLSTPVSSVYLFDDEEKEENTSRKKKKEREIQYPGVQYPGYSMPSFIPRKTLTRGSQSQIKYTLDVHSEDEGIGLTPTSVGSGSSASRFTLSREAMRNSLMSRDSYGLGSASFVSRDLELGSSTVNTPVNKDFCGTLQYKGGKFTIPRPQSVMKKSLTQSNSAPEMSSSYVVTPKTIGLDVTTAEVNAHNITADHRKVKSSYDPRTQRKPIVPPTPHTTHSTLRPRKTGYSKNLHKPPPGSRSTPTRSNSYLNYTSDDKCWAVKLNRENLASGSEGRFDQETDLFQIKSVFKEEDLRATRSFANTPSGHRKGTAKMTGYRYKSDNNLNREVRIFLYFLKSLSLSSILNLRHRIRFMYVVCSSSLVQLMIIFSLNLCTSCNRLLLDRLLLVVSNHLTSRATIYSVHHVWIV